MKENLVIVESPAKAKTIEKFLGKDFQVISSYGHIRDLAKKNLSIDVANDFTPLYEIPDEKKKIVAELKKAAKTHNIIWLASDEDREGEAISWHLQETLGLTHARTKRIVFHEITKDAILNAINNPRDINQNLVNAQQARRILDRIVGYEISPVLWKKIMPALSAGRVQSVAVRLLVDRENEILNFSPSSSYKVKAEFSGDSKGKSFVLSADLVNNLPNEKTALEFLEHCKKAIFIVNSIEKKDAKRSPAPPFTTSTLQQEASRKLGFSVSRTMQIAQKLYEAGYITYMRTDSVHLSNLAIGVAKNKITHEFGATYSKTRQFQTKSKGAQEAHEAIRPTHIENKTIKGNATEMRLYELIWKRTVASQMADAQFEKTTIKIDTQIEGITEKKYEWVTKGEVIKFDGFLKLYMESKDDDFSEDENLASLLPDIEKNINLIPNQITANQKFTNHLPRYTEASLVRKMEELGIGRPSTYAPTISTIQARKYVVKDNIEGKIRTVSNITLKGGKILQKTVEEKFGYEKSKLIPTDTGAVVNKFLMENFNDIVDFNFTANVEKQFDSIAEGKLEWVKMIKAFYEIFHEKISLTEKNAKKETGERILGKDPKTGKLISAKIGRYGPYIQIGEVTDEDKPKFFPLPKELSVSNVTLQDALKLFDLPKTVGMFENIEITASIGRFGPYIKHNNQFYSIPKEDSIYSLTQERAIEIMLAKRETDKKKVVKVFENDKDLQVLNGRWGVYVKYKKKNYKIPKKLKDKDLSYDECMEIINVSDKSSKK